VTLVREIVDCIGERSVFRRGSVGSDSANTTRCVSRRRDASVVEVGSTSATDVLSMMSQPPPIRCTSSLSSLLNLVVIAAVINCDAILLAPVYWNSSNPTCVVTKLKCIFEKFC